jgi:hypothetical protein
MIFSAPSGFASLFLQLPGRHKKNPLQIPEQVHHSQLFENLIILPPLPAFHFGTGCTVIPSVITDDADRQDLSEHEVSDRREFCKIPLPGMIAQ